VRYSGISIAYQVGGMIGGAVTPLVATALQGAGGSMLVAGYLVALSLASLVAAVALPARAARARDSVAAVPEPGAVSP
jgi:hypothetical protein